MKIYQKYKVLTLLLIITLVSFSFTFYPKSYAASTTVKVINNQRFDVVYYWCQHLDGHWSSGYTYQGVLGTFSANNVLDTDGVTSVPVASSFPQDFSLSAPTSNWEYDTSDSNLPPVGQRPAINNSNVVGKKPSQTPILLSGEVIGTPKVINDTILRLEGKTGKGAYGEVSSACGASPSMSYRFSISLTWYGEYVLPSTEGTAVIKHFTDTGQSLSSIFPDRQETLVKDQTYPYTHPTNSNYDYLGYIKTTTGATPSYPQGLTQGNPPSFKYDNSFPKYTLYNYYQLKSGGIPAPEPEPEPDPDPNEPPVAVISAPDEVRQGDEFSLNGYMSRDPDGTIVKYDWFTDGANGKMDGIQGRIWYDSTGPKFINLIVEDNDGAMAGDQKLVSVIDPYIYAHIDLEGTAKENRKLTLINASDTPTHYPITSTKWTINGINGASNGDIRYSGTLNGRQRVDILFKKPGQYEVTLDVENSASYRDTTTTILNISPDLPPIPQFSATTWLYRDPMNSNYAQMEIQDLSSSPDGDLIEGRILNITYNKNNNYLANSIVIDIDDPDPGLKAKTIYSNFTDDTRLSIDLTLLNLNQLYPYSINEVPLTVLKKPNGIIQVKTKNVGRYLIDMQITEAFGQPTIPEFVTASDRKSSNTNSKPLLEKIVTIDNRAPTVNFKP